MLNPKRDPRLLGIGIQAAGAVHIHSCREAGLDDERVRWLVESGRWRALWPRVYVTFSGPIPLLTLQHAAVLYAGKGSALSHQSAAALWNLRPAPPQIHVTVPYDRQVDAQVGLVLHRSRTLSKSDIHPAAAPRRTRVERTVLDLLGDCRSADAALALVADSVRRRLTAPDRLRSALIERPRTRWRKLVLEALPDVAAGAQSPLELRDAAMRRRHGLPRGRRQVRRVADGAEYLDIVIAEFGLHVELDGRLGHDRAREVWRDMRRDNRSEVSGLRHLRYGWADLVDRPCEVAREQARVLSQQGWPGPFRVCPSCPAGL